MNWGPFWRLLDTVSKQTSVKNTSLGSSIVCPHFCAHANEVWHECRFNKTSPMIKRIWDTGCISINSTWIDPDLWGVNSTMSTAEARSSSLPDFIGWGIPATSVYKAIDLLFSHVKRYISLPYLAMVACPTFQLWKRKNQGLPGFSCRSVNMWQ